ncbi:hypothetical protein MMC13_001998 [Lambiella insularis]|nr:hypothetical protein [Lambiella insularis]
MSILSTLLARGHLTLLFHLSLLFSLSTARPSNPANIFSHGIPPRSLRAASLAIDVAKRGLHVPLHHELSLHYVEAETSSGHVPFSAHVHLGSSRPVLALEDIEHLIESVQCDADSARVTFNSAQHLWTVRDALSPGSGFALVTSHWSCNDEGSRVPYLVHESFYDEESSAVEFSIEPISWQNGFDSLRVDFGRDDHRSYSLRPHRHLQRRDYSSLANEDSFAAASTTGSASVSSVLVSSTTILTPTTNIAFPTPASTSQPTATSIVQDIGSQLINTQILPSNNSVLAAAQGLVVPDGLSITCVNCTTSGSLELLTGSFLLNGDNSTSNSTDDVVRFIEHGFAEVVANNLFAHIELSTTWLAAQAGQGAFTINLASIPLQPFSIPDIAVIGPLFNPRLVIGVDVGMDVDFHYGFEVAVPNNATALANIGNLSSSSLTGFAATTFTLLPFQAAVGNLALNLSATLQPEILIGFSFLNGVGNAGAGIFLELPQLALEIAPAVGTNEKCEPITNITLASHIQQLFGNLTHIVPEVELAGGFIAQATLGPSAFAGDKHQTAYTPLATTFAAPTACLAFDGKANSYVPVSALATGTGNSVGAATPTAGAARQKGQIGAVAWVLGMACIRFLML